MTESEGLWEPGVYAIRNMSSGRRYVGSARLPRHRWQEHREMLARGNHHNWRLQEDWSRLGAASFRFDLLETVADPDPQALGRAEQRWLPRLLSENSEGVYNMALRVTRSVRVHAVSPAGSNEGIHSAGVEEWVSTMEAARLARVSLRTVRRWIAAETVVSRLEQQEGVNVRSIRRDTLPPGSDNGHGDRPPLSQPATGDNGHRDTEGDVSDGGDTGLGRLVAAQESEIAHLRAQLEQRALEMERQDHAEAELRRLLLISQQALAAVVEQPKALPPAPEPAPPKRLRWWMPWRR